MFKELLKESLKVEINENGAMGQLKQEEGASPENSSQEAPAEEKVEITPELVAGLIEKLPELEGIDAGKLEVGMKAEMEHLASISADVDTLAKVAADHIKAYPEADYYAALAEMEASLVPPPAEEEKPAEEEAPVEEEKPAEEKELSPEEDAAEDKEYESKEGDSLEEAKSKKAKRDAKKAKKDAKKAKKKEDKK